MFIMSIAVGSLFLIALEYVAGADWSVPLRRLVEFFAALIPVMFILVIPLLLNIHTLFHWSHAEAVSTDAILQGKSAYLNSTFFIIRVFGILIVWTLFYLLFTRNSMKQDITKDQKLTKHNILFSAIFIPVFAITITISSIDWMMSLEPHWFSTIFGVYYFSGTFLAALAALTLAVIFLNEKGVFGKLLIPDHLYSLGALQFVFINFWGYIAFSQYLLIWYADLPEETVWFLHRWEGGWVIVSILLIFVHFVVPYAVLLSQPAKMDPKRLKFASIWILFAHLLDLYWLIMPNMSSGKEGSVPFGWIELVFPVALVGLIIVVFTMRAKNKNIIPIGDPKIERGLDFHL
ncbi:MAG: quinol:cytochrome C oxidoreductase [Ignavibacteriaceae bacterium]|nr:quinol:cytochrome C oxidoreductase [Ignavibacteriaceae bacterium]